MIEHVPWWSLLVGYFLGYAVGYFLGYALGWLMGRLDRETQHDTRRASYQRRPRD